MAKGLDLKLDKAWSAYVKERAGNRCEYCGSTKNLNSHHIIGRRNKATRWEISNGVCICPLHHVFSSTFSAHQTPTIFSEWIIKKRGEQWHEELVLMANTVKKWTKPDKEALLQELNGDT